ncbi:MAG TPA: magnesium chelatase domain-containing protein, partial [Bdellovibrionota bacterium]|nr:magnesium chelatase domain-containing protein [Bdellovibrionota bacterium]
MISLAPRLQLQLGMVSHVHSGVIIGIKGALVTVEVESTPGLPEFAALGSNDPVVKESKHRITSALRAINVPLPPRKIIVNLAPAGLPKRGTAFDLSIAMALLHSAGEIHPNSTVETLFLGELALDGTLRPCSGVIPIGMTALLHGLTSMIVPVENSEEAACLPHLNVYVAHHLSEVLAHCKGEKCLEKVSPLPWSEELNPSHLFSEIIGQHVPKRALEIAAAGRHHLLFVGPPGSGKSMLAQCLPQLLPPLGDSEA